MIKSLMLSLLIILTLTSGWAQQKKIEYGDIIPDIVFKNTFNYDGKPLKLSDFRGKLVILDFWGVNCKSCLEDFPHLDSLQAKFKNDIKIICITANTKQAVAKLFEGRKKLKMPSLTYVSDDTVYYNLTPHNGVPFHIWVDTSGRYLIKPEDYETNERNVSAYLRGERLNMKKHENHTYVSSVFKKDAEASMKYFSYLSLYNNQTLTSVDLPNITQVMVHNRSAVGLYQEAYAEGRFQYFLRPGKLELHFKDSSKYLRPKGKDDAKSFEFFNEKYSYNYNLVIPKSKEKKIYKIWQEDLSRFFDITASIENREVLCYVLVQTGNTDSLLTKGGKRVRKFLAPSILKTDLDSIRYYRNVPLSELTESIQWIFEEAFKIPFTSEVNFSGNIDVDFSGAAVDSLSPLLGKPNMEGFQKELNKYGLAIIQKKCAIDVLVLRDAN